MKIDEIRNIWCIGRSYSAHLNGQNPSSLEPPITFLKAGSTIQNTSSMLMFPKHVTNIQHELELALQWDLNLNTTRACLALDFTEPKVQEALINKGEPWTIAKNFTGATAITDFFEFQSFSDLKNFEMKLFIDSELKQQASISEMLYDLNYLIDYVEKHYPVCPGDLLLTGTPAGVGLVKPGQTLKITCNRGISKSWCIKKDE